MPASDVIVLGSPFSTKIILHVLLSYQHQTLQPVLGLETHYGDLEYKDSVC